MRSLAQLEKLRSGPPTLSVPAAARALGCSPAHAYTCIRLGTFPAQTISIGTPGRLRVLTWSVVRILEGEQGSGDAA